MIINTIPSLGQYNDRKKNQDYYGGYVNNAVSSVAGAAKPYNSGSKKTYGNGSTIGNTSTYDPMVELMAAYEQQRRNQINAKRAIIDQQIALGRENILAEKAKVGETYQPLKNQSEVNRFTAEKKMRENQANRGALDSGTGRQESLALQNNYGNNLSQIMMQEQEELSNYDRGIRNLESQGNIQKAQVENDMSADLASYLNQINLSGFQNQSRTAAQNVVNRSANNIPKNSVEDAVYSGANPNVYRNTTPGQSMVDIINLQLKTGLITKEEAERELAKYMVL